MSSVLGSELERSGSVSVVIIIVSFLPRLPLSPFHHLPSVSLPFLFSCFFTAPYLPLPLFPFVTGLPSYILVPDTFQVSLLEWSWGGGVLPSET